MDAAFGFGNFPLKYVTTTPATTVHVDPSITSAFGNVIVHL